MKSRRRTSRCSGLAIKSVGVDNQGREPLIARAIPPIKNPPMQQDRTSLILGVLLVAVGGGWLLSSLGFIPSVDWAWSSGLAVVGVLAVVLSGFDKVSFVVAGFFVLASVLSVLRQMGIVKIEVEIPILVLAAGLLLIGARSSAIPLPRWIVKG